MMHNMVDFIEKMSTVFGTLFLVTGLCLLHLKSTKQGEGDEMRLGKPLGQLVSNLQ